MCSTFLNEYKENVNKEIPDFSIDFFSLPRSKKVEHGLESGFFAGKIFSCQHFEHAVRPLGHCFLSVSFVRKTAMRFKILMKTYISITE